MSVLSSRRNVCQLRANLPTRPAAAADRAETDGPVRARRTRHYGSVRRALPLLVLVLATPGQALAHVGVAPPSLRAGQETALTLIVPNERVGHAMTRLDVIAPADVELVGASGPPGWDAQAAERRAVWRGSLPPQATVSLSLDARALGSPAPVTLRAVQRFDDGGSARWELALTVLPATETPRMRLGRAAVAATTGIAVVGASLLVLRRLRRRPSRR